MTTENWNLAIAVGQLLFAFLVFLGIDKNYVSRWIPTIPVRSRLIYVLIVGGLAFSGYGFYLANRRPTERIVEKPVDRVVEKIVQSDCPKPPQKQSGLVIPPGAKISAEANGTGGMAAGINTGTMIQGDRPPQFSLSRISANKFSPASNVYETLFDLHVTTERAVLVNLKATSTYLTSTITVWKKVPPNEDGGLTLNDMAPAENGVATVKVLDVETGDYLVTVRSTKPDEITLTYK